MLLCLLLTVLSLNHARAQAFKGALPADTDSLFIRNAFRVADAYMDTDHYDSAQLWLNKIHERISYLQPSLFSYFLTTRQAEVYYYNNLQQLGIQEAQRALNIAEILNDSILRADAYNFCGLFHTNTGKLQEAIQYFKKGIALVRQPPYPSRYLELSKPYHLYGNLAEAFDKDREQDSAIFYGRMSLVMALKMHQNRGAVSAGLSLGSSFLKKKNPDSAIFFFEGARAAAVESKDFDLNLIACGGLADCASLKNQKQKALALWKQGFALLNQHPQLNSFYQLLFLEGAAAFYKQHRLYEQLANTLQRKSAIQTATNRKNNEQYRNILMTGLKNETRILNLEIAKAKHGRVLATTRLYVVGLVILLLTAGFIAYRYYSLQQLKVAHVRNRISQDLHDEVGATLSGIALYSYIARQQNEAQEVAAVTQSLNIIDNNATDMVKKLSDIVWAVNPVHDSLAALLQRLEDFAVEMASVKGIVVILQKEPQVTGVKITMEQRKNIYLIMKEAVNNAIKHSGCTRLLIKATQQNKELLFSVQDNGSGFEESSIHRGNGLLNMQSRAADLRGKVLVESMPAGGTTIHVVCGVLGMRK